MKEKVAILGSTGSIGKTTFNIFKKDKKNFEIILLSTDKNINLLIKQANVFNVKNLIVTDRDSFLYIKKKLKKKILRFLIILIILVKFLKKELTIRCVQYLV